MPKTKTPAPLTVRTATRQARAHVDRLMPGVMATVATAGGWDTDRDAQLMVTTITYPYQHEGRYDLEEALMGLRGLVAIRSSAVSIRIERLVQP